MSHPLKDQIEAWHDADEYRKIVDTINALPEDELDDYLLGRLASSYNNIGTFEEDFSAYTAAHEALMRQSDAFKATALWHYRLGYTFYFLDLLEKAIEMFEKSRTLYTDEDRALLEEDTIELLEACRKELAAYGGAAQQTPEIQVPETKRKASTSGYVSVLTSDKWITVSFQSEQEKPFKIGEKMASLHAQAYMNGYNWAAVLVHYLKLHHPDILIGMDSDPEAGSYAAYYPVSPESQTRAEAFMHVIELLIENEDALYKFVREEGGNIEWD